MIHMSELRKYEYSNYGISPINLPLEGVEVTEELCVAHAQEFDWRWAREQLLTEEQQAEYRAVQQPAYAVYDAVEQSAWAAYEAVQQPAWDAYQEACAVAFARAVAQ